MSKQVMIGNTSDVPAGGLKTFDAHGTALVVAKVGDGYCAVINK